MLAGLSQVAVFVQNVRQADLAHGIVRMASRGLGISRTRRGSIASGVQQSAQIIEREGSLGEVLRSPSIGDKVRDKVGSSILSAIKKGTNMGTTLPPGVESIVSIRRMQFASVRESEKADRIGTLVGWLSSGSHHHAFVELRIWSSTLLASLQQ